MLQNLHRRFVGAGPDLSYVLPVKSTVKISKRFVAFSEYKNFTKSDKMGHVLAVPGQAIQKSNLHINGQMDPKTAIMIC